MALARLAFRFLLVSLVLLVLIGLALPSSTHVEREIAIQATPERVFGQLNSMRRFHAWSPWNRPGPGTRYVFEGPDEGVGSRLRWYSDEDGVGAGSQEIIASEPNRSVTMTLVFGDKGNGTSTFELRPEGTSTRLTWTFHTDFGWDLYGRYLGLMLDNVIGAAYDRGLRRLKWELEPEPDFPVGFTG
jgi:uncharacterized protein YndB with AHSA1/START domain